jgi:5-bromo-4-chloroindolyl phosphate hydrolysis protein
LTETNGNRAKLIWWIISLFGLTMAGMVGFIFSNMKALDMHVTALEVQAATRTEKVRFLEAEFESIGRELSDIRVKIQEMLIKASQNETSIKVFENRLNEISGRLVMIVNHLENISPSKMKHD